MIPIEVRESSTRRLLFQPQHEESMRVELETTDEVLETVRIKEEAAKLKQQGDTIQRFNHEPFN